MRDDCGAARFCALGGWLGGGGAAGGGGGGWGGLGGGVEAGE